MKGVIMSQADINCWTSKSTMMMKTIAMEILFPEAISCTDEVHWEYNRQPNRSSTRRSKRHLRWVFFKPGDRCSYSLWMEFGEDKVPFAEFLVIFSYSQFQINFPLAEFLFVSFALPLGYFESDLKSCWVSCLLTTSFAT